MTALTITEALAEVKTIDARIAKKKVFIGENIYRQDKFRDPMEKNGGSKQVIAQERQSIQDLLTRKLNLRRAIQHANDITEVSINNTTRSISDWLVWRREIVPILKDQLNGFAQVIQSARQEAARKGLAVITTNDVATTVNDLIINIDEKQLSKEIEDIENILGVLDGQLSLKNATIMLEV